ATHRRCVRIGYGFGYTAARTSSGSSRGYGAERTNRTRSHTCRSVYSGCAGIPTAGIPPRTRAKTSSGRVPPLSVVAVKSAGLATVPHTSYRRTGFLPKSAWQVTHELSAFATNN